MEFNPDKDGTLELTRYQKLFQDNDSLQVAIHNIELRFEKELEEMDKKDNGIGEGGSEAKRVAYCAARDKINDKYLETVNTLLESENLKWISYWKKAMSNWLNYCQYNMPEDAFEVEKLRAQLMWLGFIGGQEVEFENKCTFGSRAPKQKLTPKKLADFYDMTCKQKSVMELGIGSITIECNKMTTQLDSKFMKFTVKENMDTDQIIQGTAEFGSDFDLTKPSEFGPVKAELKGEIYGFIEFDGQGVTDVGIKAGAKAGLSTNAVEDHQVKESLGFVDDKSVTVIGTEARWGWNSGPSLEGKGILSGLNTK